MLWRLVDGEMIYYRFRFDWNGPQHKLTWARAIHCVSFSMNVNWMIWLWRSEKYLNSMSLLFCWRLYKPAYFVSRCCVFSITIWNLKWKNPNAERSHTNNWFELVLLATMLKSWSNKYRTFCVRVFDWFGYFSSPNVHIDRQTFTIYELIWNRLLSSMFLMPQWITTIVCRLTNEAYVSSFKPSSHYSFGLPLFLSTRSTHLTLFLSFHYILLWAAFLLFIFSLNKFCDSIYTSASNKSNYIETDE